MIRKLCEWVKGKPLAAPTPLHTVTVHETLLQEHYWHEKGANGEITCHSEMFTRKADAERAAKAHCEARRVYVAP